MSEEVRYVPQAAAVPVRDGRVCLITSISGRRWIVPKGVIDPGFTAQESALQEAWEEAGLRGELDADPLGAYVYEKLGRGHHVTVFLMRVVEEAASWPEERLRKRRWVTVNKALAVLEEPELCEMIASALGPEGRVGEGPSPRGQGS